MNTPQNFMIDPAWKERGGALFAFPHFDDESLFWMTLSLLRSKEIPTTFLTATFGERGKDKGEYKSPAVMKKIRQTEYERATAAIGVQREALDLGDFGLELLNYKELIVPILEVIRRVDPAVIITFHPFETTQQFYHPDHNLMGKVVFDAASAMDIKDFLPESGSATSSRSSLYAWTTRQDLATHFIPFPPQYREQRIRYLKTFYPSQFQKKDEERWQVFFDRINAVENGIGIELLTRIRD